MRQDQPESSLEPLPKKILFIHHGKGLGGAPLSLLYLIKGLNAKQYHPVVLFLQDSDVIDMYRSHGIETVGPLNLMDFPHTKIWWLRWYHATTIITSIIDTYKTIFYYAPRIFELVRPDIIHLNTSSLIGWGLAAKRKKIPVVWHIREPLAPGYIGVRRAIVKKCVDTNATAIIPICHDNASPWQSNIKTNVIYNAVPENYFDATINPLHFLKRYHLTGETPIILFLGGISKEKGTHIILQTFDLLRQKLPHAKLLIAGNSNIIHEEVGLLKRFFPAARFKKQVTNLIGKMSSSVILLGNIQDVPGAMAASSVVVFPATVGHFARPIIEAGFMQKPTIASNLAPLNELIINDNTGFLINPYNFDEWANKLYLLLNDKTLNQHMGKAAHDFCLQHFNIKDHVKSVQNIYNTILSKESSS
jgi:glycosyltransferase involved in cell wall biosynthesis